MKVQYILKKKPTRESRMKIEEYNCLLKDKKCENP